MQRRSHAKTAPSLRTNQVLVAFEVSSCDLSYDKA